MRYVSLHHAIVCVIHVAVAQVQNVRSIMTLSVMRSTQLVLRRKVRMQKSNVMRILVGGVFFSDVILLVILFTM